MNLPPYASTPIGRALIAEIIASPPESRIVRDDWGHHPTYFAKPASLLRRLHREWKDRQFALLDAQFAVSGFWDADASKAICATEDADQLIRRVLSESAVERRAA